MLFNSYGFILVFLPVTLLVYFLIGARDHHRLAIAWLVAASFFFYGWWNPAYVSLILISILFNYSLGTVLSGHAEYRRSVLAVGIVANLALLGYYKYANFFVDNVSLITGTQWEFEPVVLPLAISFFTFQQIAYLVDAYQGQTREYNFLHYCLFVTFFPQLIAGPIVHHKEMMPQFGHNRVYRFSVDDFSLGLSIFSIGLFKKVIVADGVAIYSTPVFDTALQHHAVGLGDAWVGALAFTFQLYFDFSAYSDMALGIARMFGIKLPINFNSPYKARNIIDFWRRWHITLSRFLRDYLYIPLGGNRKGKLWRYINLMVVMLLGGLWHGAGWTFIIWGGLHGSYLMVNHAWHYFIRHYFGVHHRKNRLITIAGILLTFLMVVVGWVFFRAESVSSAIHMVNTMFGRSSLTDEVWIIYADNWLMPVSWLTLLGTTVWLLPNLPQWMAIEQPGDVKVILDPLPRWLRHYRFRFSGFWAFFCAMLLVISLFGLTRVSEFLYFQF